MAISENVGLVKAPRGPALSQSQTNVAIQVAFVVSVLILWEAAARIFDTDFWTSSPSQVVAAMIAWAKSGVLWNDLRVTLTAAGVGFVVGSLVGGLVGFVLGWVRRLGDLFEPFVLALYTLPKIALAPCSCFGSASG